MNATTSMQDTVSARIAKFAASYDEALAAYDAAVADVEGFHPSVEELSYLRDRMMSADGMLTGARQVALDLGLDYMH